jgi:hypothetical protein
MIEINSWRFTRQWELIRNEKNLSTKQYQKKKDPWISYPHGITWGTQGFAPAPGEGSKKADGLGAAEAGAPVRAGGCCRRIGKIFPNRPA